jgi:hypothetical protein
LDEDPNPRYTITYELMNVSPRSEFSLSSSPNNLIGAHLLPDPFRKRRYSREQLPHAVQLQVQAPLRKKVYYLNVTAVVSDKKFP